MNLALFCSFSPALNPAPVLAAEQILFTPWLEDETLDGRAVIRRTAAGHFDAAETVRALDPAQAPDAVAVLLDERCASWPRGLAALACPKVLLVADGPLTVAGREALADYLAREDFDHVVGLSDRSAALALRSLGARNVAWLPGWHFPHAEEALDHGRKAHPRNRVGVCVRRHGDDRAVLAAAKAIALRGLTVHARVAPAGERPLIYGASAVALLEGKPGDLRLLESLAVGAPTLCTRPSADAGWDLIFPDGLAVVFDEPEEAADAARDLLADPAEAHALGDQGARWFDRCFSSGYRREVLAALALDRRVAPEFELPAEAAAPVFPAPAAPGEEDADGRRACDLAERGEFSAAFALATETIRRDGASWRSCLAIAEVAMETRTADLWRTMLARVRTQASDDEHLARLELGSRGLLTEWRAMRGLMQVWEACAERAWKAAIERAEAVLRRYPQCAEAAFAAGYACLQWARQERRLAEGAAALGHLQAAVESAPHRPDFQSALAAAQEYFRRELEPTAATEAGRGCESPPSAVR